MIYPRDMKRVVLISCASKKLPHPAPAGDLYVSSLFQFCLRYAGTLKPDVIFILSAKYGLVALDQWLEPYNDTLNTKRNADIKEWAQGVLEQLRSKVDLDRDTVIFLAGEKYRRYLVDQIKHYEIPLKGLSIGRQLQYLKRALAHAQHL
jgi:hypothetical protein